MKKKLPILFIAIVAVIAAVSIVFNNKGSNTEEVAQVAKIKALHKENLENSPYKNSEEGLSKMERYSKGLPPNKYMEDMWELTMNPELGYPTVENIETIIEDREQTFLNALSSGRVPGDAVDNGWQERGPNNVGGRTRAVMFDPNDPTDETVYAGGVSGGLWVNINISNPASVWRRVDLPENLNVSSIAYDPNDTSVFYVGTGESYVGHTKGSISGNGVWKSTDGGETWNNVFGGRTGDSFFQASSTLTINSPGSIAADYATFPTSNFGSEIINPITSNLVVVNDASATPTLGCDPLVNGAQVSGKIALIRRGDCSFVIKVKNAQDAGAVAAIVMNNIDGTPIAMGGSDPTITIPAVMISKDDGDLIEAALQSGAVNGTLNPDSGSFTAINVPGVQHVNDLVVRNNGGNSEIYLAASDAIYGTPNASTVQGGLTFGLYKSVDDGATWTRMAMPTTPNGNEYALNDIEIGADNTIWVASTSSKVFGDGGGTIFSSNDGITFTVKHSFNGSRTQIATSPTDANKIFVLGEGNSTTPVFMFKTDDGFATTTNMALPNDADTNIDANDFTRGQAFFDLAIAVDPNNENNLYTGGIDLFKSTNAGTSWSQFSHWYGGFGHQEVHADQHGIAFGHNNSNKVVFGNDGGVYYSSNGGTTTTARNNGYNVTQFYSVGVAPAADGEHFAGGTQDNGTQFFGDAATGINSSVEVQGGDGAAVMFDQVGTDTYYITNYVYNNNINKRNLGTGAVTSLNSENTNRGSFICEQALDSNLDILYTNYSYDGNYIVRRYNHSSFFINRTNLTDDLLTSTPTALTVSPYTTNSTKLMVGTVLGDLLLVENANGNSPTWTDISGPSFVGSVSDIEFGQTENDIFVTMYNYGVNNIWYTNDGGSTWALKDGDLPDMPVLTILQNPLRLEEVIIGTDVGVWYTNNFDDASPNWQSAYNGMSYVKVIDLDVRDDNMVFAATHGRGIFSGQFTMDALSVNETAETLSGVKLFPTVSHGEFTIKSEKAYGKTDLVVYGISGRQVYSTQFDLNSTGKVFNLRLPSGVYLAKMINNNVEETKKFIIK
ncbi:MAG: T9SS type A sorting domain-containing protein [Algicola sp.]|nr:T9SS type A sorting domain-containing protein [Algicola sp.]